MLFLSLPLNFSPLLSLPLSILGSCSDLMKAIHMLVTAATDLQKDIVESGRVSSKYYICV